MEDQHDTTKLPKWTQDRLQRLELDLQFWKDKVMALTSKKKTNIKCGFLDNIYYLNEHHFEIDTERGNFHITIRNGLLNISSVIGEIRVIPCARNSIDLETKEWRGK